MASDGIQLYTAVAHTTGDICMGETTTTAVVIGGYIVEGTCWMAGSARRVVSTQQAHGRQQSWFCASVLPQLSPWKRHLHSRAKL